MDLASCGLGEEKVGSVFTHEKAVGECQAVDQDLNLLGVRVIFEQSASGVTGYDNVQELPSVEPRAGLGEVDNSSFLVNLDAVGEAEGAPRLSRPNQP